MWTRLGKDRLLPHPQKVFYKLPIFAAKKLANNISLLARAGLKTLAIAGSVADSPHGPLIYQHPQGPLPGKGLKLAFPEHIIP